VIEKATEIEHSKFVEAGKSLLEGAKEKDIVYGGLEEVMSTATNQVLDVAESKNLDLRTAAYVLAINKLNDFYTTRGIDI
jgi:glutamate dehydrogenase (NAD(P)+)